MRKLVGTWTAAVLAVAIVGWVTPASAQLTYDDTSTLSVQFGTLPPMVLTTPGGMATVNDGLGGAVGLAGGDFTGSALNTLFSTIAPPLTSLSLINGGNLGGTVTPGVGGTLGILGTVNANVSHFPLVAAPLNFGAMTGAGIGGTAKVGVVPYNATMTYGTWTTGAVTITPVDAGGIPDPTPSVRTGSDNRTAGGNGKVTLVTPIVVKTGLAGTTAVFGILTLNFAPEPGNLLLLLSGATGALLMGGLRGRRSAKRKEAPSLRRRDSGFDDHSLARRHDGGAASACPS